MRRHRPRGAESAEPLSAGAMSLVLLAALTAALCLRLGIAGPSGARSVSAGLVFAATLLAVALAARHTVARWTWLPDGAPRLSERRLRAAGPVRRLPSNALIRCVGLGLVGAAVLSSGPYLAHLLSPGSDLDTRALPLWAVVVSSVAVAEEALLRGALWSSLQAWHGPWAALAGTTAAFALMHVPLYGWGALLLDTAVGLLLGGLRMAGGAVLAPTLAHTAADLAGWWLR